MLIREGVREVRGEVLAVQMQEAPAPRREARILAQSVAPGSWATLVCRLHGIGGGRLYTWRRQPQARCGYSLCSAQSPRGATSRCSALPNGMEVSTGALSEPPSSE